jgi:hypothetical protein
MSHEAHSLIASQLGAMYEAAMPPLPLPLVELLARLCVAEAMAQFDRSTCRS